MQVSEKTKILILFALFAIALYFMYENSKNTKSKNDKFLERFASDENDMTKSDMSEFIDVNKSRSSMPSDNSTNMKYEQKLKSPNSATTDDYKSTTYKSGNRLNNTSSLDSFFEGNNAEDNKNNNYTAYTDNEARYAAYSAGRDGKKLTETDKFDAGALLPNETNMDWFDDPYESTSVKASHLINIFRPVGVNTIQTSLKNPSHDLRGTEPNPKYPVSPWMNSSYEPDTNLKSKAFC
jgi:hypothetical protein